jgi:hypothetical protein
VEGDDHRPRGSDLPPESSSSDPDAWTTSAGTALGDIEVSPTKRLEASLEEVKLPERRVSQVSKSPSS